MRALLYLRLSQSADDSTSIARQSEDLHALAERKGWHVADVLVDDGISGRVARANAEEAVRRLRDDEADVLAVWKLDRWTRQGWDGLGALSAALIARERADRPALFVALQDGLSSDQAAFRLIAGVLSEVARTEAENTAARLRSAIDYRRRNGKFAGAGNVPYGYRSTPAPDGVGRVLEPDPDEAAIVREIAERIVKGERLRFISADLTRRGVPTARSAYRKAVRRGRDAQGLDRGRWNIGSVRAVWCNMALAGRVMHQGDYLRDDDGMPVTVWPPVLSASDVEAVRLAIDWTPPRGAEIREGRPDLIDKPRKAPQSARAARLLSGVVFCGTCERRMFVTAAGAGVVYRCRGSWDSADGICSGVVINAERAEAVVSERFLSVTGEWPEVREDVAPSVAAAAAELREIDAALRIASASLLDDDADTAAIFARVAALKARRVEVVASTPRDDGPVLVPTGRTIAEAWNAPDTTDDQRRAMLDWGIDHVVIDRAGPGTFKPERVRILWAS